MDKEYEYFEKWYKSQESRFHTCQFSTKEEACAAFYEGIKYTNNTLIIGKLNT